MSEPSRGGPGQPWTHYEINKLRRLRQSGATYDEIAEKIGRSKEAIEKRLQIMRMRIGKPAGKGPTLTEHRKERMRAYWGVKIPRVIASTFNVPVELVHKWAAELGLGEGRNDGNHFASVIPDRPRGWSPAEVYACRDAGGPEWALMAGMLGVYGRKDQAAKGMEQ
jgi:hypothetical protein